MIKKKKSTKKNLKKIWKQTKKTAKVVQKEVATAGRGLTKVGESLSGVGGAIQESFRPTDNNFYLARQELYNYYNNLKGKLPMKNYLSYLSKKYNLPLTVIDGIHNEYATGKYQESTYAPYKKSMKKTLPKQHIPQKKLIGKREPYKPYGYKKTLSFGWGGY